MIIIFWPLGDFAEQPPFAEEMETIPCKGEYVAFFKTEPRHPVMDARRGARDHGYRVAWIVTSRPFHIPDLGAVVVRVESVSALSTPMMKTLEAAAQALDLETPPSRIA